MNIPRDRWIRFGVLAFLIAGLVDLLGALTPGIGINPATDPAGFAQNADLVGLANLAGIVGLVFLLFGFQALQGFLADTSAGKWAFSGMILSIAGIGLYLPFLGVIAFAGPVAGKAYLNGQVQAVSIISDSTSVTNLSTLIVGGVAVLFYILGSILFSVAIWNSKRITKWAAVAYAVSAPLNIIPHYIPLLWLAGAVLALGAGMTVVRAVWKESKSSLVATQKDA